MSTLKVDAIVDSSNGNTTTINGATPTAYNTMGKNRIINGTMEIDQRNAGASVTPSANVYTYTVDRFSAYCNQASKFTVQQSTTAPTGFINSLLATSSSAYSITSTDIFVLDQMVEGLNCADLAWGTASAKPVTLSFWVRSSLTGTFGGSIQNSAQNRSYPFSYTISSANTFEQKTITIAGDTSGTWLTTSGIGMRVYFGLGCGSVQSGTAGAWAGASYYSATGATSVVGTSGATFYITGVQLEAGSVATEFERRPYGTELQLCQRYYEKVTTGGGGVVAIGHAVNSTAAVSCIQWSTVKRASPTITTVGTPIARDAGGNSIAGSVNTEDSNPGLWQFNITVSGGLAAGNASQLRFSGGYYAASAEL